MRTVAVEADNDAKAEAGKLVRDERPTCTMQVVQRARTTVYAARKWQRQAAGGRVRVGRARAADCATLFGYCRERNLRFSTSGG